MIMALQKADREVPNYLRALAGDHLAPSRVKRMAFAMHCFWVGEAQLGKIDGVLTTEAGWIDGREVTLVTYDSKRISERQLKRVGAEAADASKVYQKLAGYRKARASDQKRQIQGTPFSELKLSPVQTSKVNAWARVDPRKAVSWLSPTQRGALKVPRD